MNSNKAAQDAHDLSGKQKRREKNKQIREIRSHHRNDNSLALDSVNLVGPIDASKFAAARISEINSMQSAIKKASYALNELAFQSLPRGLRRRTASHNLNRLPARLRAKAAKEAAQSSSLDAPSKKKKIRKVKKPVRVVDEYLRRQKSKRWLETHLWHAKRMKMINIWGHRIAQTPNSKSARVTYRSFTRLCIAHDASYMACIELLGSSEAIGQAMKIVTDLGSPSVLSARFKRGHRVGYTHLYEPLAYPHRLICPISFLWKPSGDALWLWIHPAAYQEALQVIQHSIRDQQLSVSINDLCEKLVKFELTGPRSTALLQAILDPVSDTAGNRAWKDLRSLRSSCSLSPGSVLGLVVNDPRLSFPQKVPPRSNQLSDQEQLAVQTLLEAWPEGVSDCALWDAEVRERLMSEKSSEHQLNERRAQQLVPGTPLQPTDKDSQIPLLLFQRGAPVYAHANASRRPLASSELIEGWTLVLPQGWGMAFWKSLVFAGARVAGLMDVRAMHFESGHAYFPHDFPGTRAFELHRQQAKKEALAIWERKPPAKRVHFVKRGIEHPFECAFERLAVGEPMDQDGTPRPLHSLIQGNVLSHPLAQLQQQLNSTCLQRGLSSPLFIPDQLLAKVRLRYLDRGRPSAHAMIFFVPKPSVYQHHIRHLHPASLKTKRKLNEMLETVDEQPPLPLPPLSEHIGYVTNGNFSFSLGYGFAIGACTIEGLLKMEEIDNEQNRTIKKLVVVRNTTSLKVRPAQLEIML
ncbi:NUC188 domain-containing protein [Sporodiniella umbellata]|nr:NUC188 domain-containing protein [Sporodiniella umbellata]